MVTINPLRYPTTFLKSTFCKPTGCVQICWLKAACSLGSREILYRNFVNVMRVQAVFLLIIGKERGKRGGYIWITDEENSAKEPGVASNTWRIDFYPWVSWILTFDFYSIKIPYISAFPRFSSEFSSHSKDPLYGLQLDQEPLQARLHSWRLKVFPVFWEPLLLILHSFNLKTPSLNWSSFLPNLLLLHYSLFQERNHSPPSHRG